MVSCQGKGPFLQLLTQELRFACGSGAVVHLLWPRLLLATSVGLILVLGLSLTGDRARFGVDPWSWSLSVLGEVWCFGKFPASRA